MRALALTAIFVITLGACHGGTGLGHQARRPEGRRVLVTDSVVIENLEFGAAAPGPNVFTARVTNNSSQRLTLGLDLRATPGLWIRRNWQHGYAFQIPPHSTQRISAPYTFMRLTPEGRLRVTFGHVMSALPTAFSGRLGDSSSVAVDLEHPLYQLWYSLGQKNPAATDPRKSMVELHTGKLDIYATKGSLAAKQLDAIAKEREHAIGIISGVLGVDFIDRVRLVFYPDSATKTTETGHIGMGWASNGTIVEIYNEQQRLNPFHELAHIIAAKLGSPPAFLNEGFAVYISEELGSNALDYLSDYGGTIDEAACVMTRRGLLIPFSRLLQFNEIGSDSTAPAIAYPEAASVVKYLIKVRGMDSFRETYRTLIATDDPAQQEKNFSMLGAILGITVSDLERDWRAGVRCEGN